MTARTGGRRACGDNPGSNAAVIRDKYSLCGVQAQTWGWAFTFTPRAVMDSGENVVPVIDLGRVSAANHPCVRQRCIPRLNFSLEDGDTRQRCTGRGPQVGGARWPDG